MVFYVIAASLPGKDENDNERTVKSALTNPNGRQIGELYNVNVDKAKFKIGTLDALMELNETLVKVDHTLDATTKKMEKLARETSNKDIFVEITGKQGKQSLEPINYIKNFTWILADLDFDQVDKVAGLVRDALKLPPQIKSDNYDSLRQLELNTVLIKEMEVQFTDRLSKYDSFNQKQQEMEKTKLKEESDKILSCKIADLNKKVFTQLRDVLQTHLKAGQTLEGDKLEDIVASFLKTFASPSSVNVEGLQTLKKIWSQAESDLFKQPIKRYSQQAAKEAQNHINQHSEELAEGDLIRFFYDQLTLMYTVAAYLTLEVPSQISEVTQKRDMLLQQISKLQKDCRDWEAKFKETNKEALKAKESQEQFMHENISLKAQLQEVIDDRIGYKMKLEEQREKLQMLVSENTAIKEKGAQAEEAMRLLRQQLLSMENLQRELQGARDELAKAQQDYEWIEKQLRGKEGEHGELKKTIANLQRAIQQNEEVHGHEARIMERQHIEDRVLIQQLESQNKEMKDKVRVLAGMEDEVAGLTQILARTREQLQQSESERMEIKRFAQEVVDKVKKDEDDMEFMVDRRLINKFLINYANPVSTPQVKAQMLDTMSKILAFSMEEKQMLGLIKKATIEESSSKSGISDRLISFFMQDDE